MRISNDGFFGIGNPVARAGNLSGLGILPGENINPETGTPWYTDTAFWTALNSEALFFTNLTRGINNQPALNVQQYAPQVAVGISPATQNFLLLAGAGLLAFSAMKGGKRRKRR